MLKVFLSKCREALISVLPVTLIVVILHMTPLISLTDFELGVFLVCSLLLVLGIGLFNLGADLAMTPIGEHVGSGLARSRNLWLLLSVCFVMGVLITVAEPDLSVLAAQVADVINGTALVLFVGLGVGLFLLLSVLKMVFHLQLSSLYADVCAVFVGHRRRQREFLAVGLRLGRRDDGTHHRPLHHGTRRGYCVLAGR